jgi:N-carbamoyl-L-amino-acid hydrolase
VIAIDADRLRADFEALAEIGGLAGRGVSRPTFSAAHLEAREWFYQRAVDAGLEPRVDAAGNHSAVLRCSGPEAATLLLGSHLDTVPVGGRYDGALGVLAALEVLRSVKDAGRELPVSLEAIDFTDEEGTLVGLLGSWALSGALRPEALAAPRGGRSALLAGLARAGLVEQRLHLARRDPQHLAGYLELHIEQGPRLERDGIDIGVVTAIAGSRSYRLTFRGARRHAGTTPMEERRDALLGAARFALAVRELVGCREFAGCVGTVGSIDVEQAAFNVVPGVARIRLELRAPSSETLGRLEAAAIGAAQTEPELTVEVESAGRWEPVKLDRLMQTRIDAAAHELGLSTVAMTSGAGHDAQALAAVTPAGMIFVPSEGGISHDPAEHTRWQDCLNGANVLLGAALAAAGG